MQQKEPIFVYPDEQVVQEDPDVQEEQPGEQHLELFKKYPAEHSEQEVIEEHFEHSVGQDEHDPERRK